MQDARCAAPARSSDSAETVAWRSARVPRPPWRSCAALQTAARDSRRNPRESFRDAPAPAAKRETPDARVPSKRQRYAPAGSLCRGRRRRRQLPLRLQLRAQLRSPLRLIEILLSGWFFPEILAEHPPPLAD